MSSSFLHEHPYPPFILEDTEKLIVGTLPPPRFSIGKLYERDVDFCYGSYHNSLWLYIDKIFDLNLRYDNSKKAIDERKSFLIKRKIGICDIVDSCVRHKMDASDLGMTQVQLRDLVGYLRTYPNIETLLFIGGNSKNGPEFFFRRQLQEHGIKLKQLNKQTPRLNEFVINNRVVQTVSLTSSSGAANLSIASNPVYKAIKATNPEFTTFEFRVKQYSEFF